MSTFIKYLVSIGLFTKINSGLEQTCSELQCYTHYTYRLFWPRVPSDTSDYWVRTRKSVEPTLQERMGSLSVTPQCLMLSLQGEDGDGVSLETFTDRAPWTIGATL